MGHAAQSHILCTIYPALQEGTQENVAVQSPAPSTAESSDEAAVVVATKDHDQDHDADDDDEMRTNIMDQP